METMHFHIAQAELFLITAFFSFGMHDKMPQGCKLGLITNSLSPGLYILYDFPSFFLILYIFMNLQIRQYSNRTTG